MGDRSNIVVRDGKEQVCFYSHWGGEKFQDAARSALKRKDLWDDFQYLAAIVAREIFIAAKENTGLGISSRIHDNEYPIVVLDVASERVLTEDENGKEIAPPVSFADYISDGEGTEAEKDECAQRMAHMA